MKKRFLALFLAMVMIFGMMPVNTFAAEATDPTEPAPAVTEPEEETAEAAGATEETTENTTQLAKPVLNVMVNGSSNAANSNPVKAVMGSDEILRIENLSAKPKYIWVGSEDGASVTSLTLLQGLEASNITPEPNKRTSNNECDGTVYQAYYYTTKYKLPIVAKATVTVADGVTTAEYYVIITDGTAGQYINAITGFTCDSSDYDPASGITFAEANSTVTLTPATTSIGSGEAQNLTWEWSTSDPAVATVDQNGVVTSIGGGTATITAAYQRISYACTVTSTAPKHGVHTYADGVCSICGTKEPKAVSAMFSLVGQDGSFVMSKDGQTKLFELPVDVNDADKDGKITINDAILMAHESHSANGAADYTAESSAYGLYIVKLWGISTTGVGYYRNDATVDSLTTELKKNDKLVAFFYRDTQNWSDLYTYFAADSYTTVTDQPKTFALNGLDKIPAGATVKVLDSNGNEVASLAATVGEDGTFSITFPNAGTYTLVSGGTANGSAPIIPAETQVTVYAPTEKTVYVTLSDSTGNFVKGKNADELYRIAVRVSDDSANPDGQITLREVFMELHKQHHPDGEAAAAASDSSITKCWGVSGYGFSYAFNDVFLMGSGTKTGTNGRSFQDKLMGTVVENGDYFNIWLLQDTKNWGDIYTYFNPVTITAQTGETSFKVSGASMFAPDGQVPAGASVKVYDSANAEQTELNTTVGTDGTFVINFPSAGTYRVELSTNGGTYIVPSRCMVTVEQPVVDTFVLSALEIAIGGNTVDTAAAQTLSPQFDGSAIEYSTPILDYVADKNNRFVWLKVTAPEGATVTAQCGKSNVATLNSDEWTVLQVQGGYFWNPTYSGPLNPGEYNKVVITLSKEGEADKVYTVTIPMQPDISNRSLNWKTNLSSALYITKDTEGAALTVEAQYKNRPLENQDVITYQWYSNTAASAEGGTAIEGATGATYSPKVSEVGTSYYYVVASCPELESVTSTVIAVTVTEEAAPKSISVVCEYPYTVPNDWAKALGGVSFVAKVDDTLVLKAVDENGKETPVVWPSSLGGGTLDQTTGSSVVYTISNTSYSYIQVTSLYDSTLKSEEKVIEVKNYSITQYNKTPTVTLATDGQTFPKISTAGGIENYTIWSWPPSADNVAELITDLTKKSSRIEFAAMRPGTIEVSFDLDLNGDGVPDGNGQTDTAVLTINGIAVEDAAGKLTKTYLESSTAVPNPTMQLKALSSTENPTFTWSSSDETVATVDENGIVTAKGVGSVIISATDGTYTGGIKVVVTSAETPYFEQIDFVTTNIWGSGLSSASWKTASFKATTLAYSGLKLTKAAASTLTLKNTTLYDTEKYTAVATYTDANGEAQSVNINSGAATELKNIPFETNLITITLTDKADESQKTVYTFEVTRPRDTTKTIANSGIVFTPDGREIWKDKYNEKNEGIMYVANDDGSFAQYQGVNANRLYYRTYALNGLESFALTLKGGSAYTHIRFSVDDGTSWTYLGQTGASGISTGKIIIPAPTGEENSVVKVMIQILDDATYAANIAAEKDGFADSEPKTYTVWVEQIPAPVVACDIETAVTDSGDWYPTFDKDRTSYRIVVAPEAAAPVLVFTVSEGAKVTIGETEQTPNEAGEYILTLTGNNQRIMVAASDGLTTKTYSFGYSERESVYVPDKVVDFLSVNSQYINGNAGGYGVNPQQTLTGGLLSLGNFGGYVTFYLENGLTDNPNNAYGVDFYVNGNAFKDTSTGTGLGSMEPGQVWVSQDGSTWYALAGSEHYETSTIWNYSVTYTKTATGGTDWKDNYGNTMASSHARSFAWPNPTIYTMNDLAKRDSFTLTGILLPCVDGSITGTDTFNAFSKGGRFGYVDLLVNGTSNPYLDNSDYSNESSGFDLAWAVDAAGNPVDVSGMTFHYVKVVTASNLMAGSANEKSTEVANLVRATSQDAAVGVTAAPSGVTVSSGENSKTISFVDGQQIYEVDLSDMEYVSILANGTADSDNIYINNQRVASGTAATGIKLSDTQRLVRIIVQNGQKEPVIYLLKLSRSTETQDLIDSVKITVDGAGKLSETTDGKVYTAEVGYRVDSIGITANVIDDAEITINENAVEDTYALTEGENSFTITATKGDATQTVTLIVTREKAPESTGTITVYFTLMGDSKHGDNGTTHTLADGNLTTWIAKTAYEIDSPTAVVDLIELALKGKYSYVNSGGNYISSINGLSEFDNGPNSGWMYTINGYHSQQGVAEQQLKDGDAIVLHYSDDWTLENSQNTGSDDAALKKVEELINAIGTVTLDSKAKIDAAQKAYDALTPDQKQQVGNFSVLTAAEKKYAQLKAADDEKKAEAVEDLIDAITEGSTTFEADVEAAQKAYSKLTADQKKLVGNYDKLINYLKDLEDEEDKEAAEAVEKLIDAIGTVTEDSEDKIKAAQDAYDKLTEEQKILVGNLAVLEAAEQKLAELKNFAAVEDIYRTTGDHLEELGTPVPGSIGGEWMLIGLIRSGREIEDVDAYYEAAVRYVQESINDSERLHSAKSTDNSRLVLALTAAGKDVTNVGGHDLLKGLNSMEYIRKQGINGPVWALLAFDSGNYPVPEGDVSREALIQVILDAQLADGGWALTGTVSDPDITGMVLQALAPYYKTNEQVKSAIDEALETLSKMQAADGSFGSIDGKSSESIAQVITGLSALGIDSHTDERFVKNGVSAIDALCAFYVEGGGFKHIPTGKLDGMATEQGYYALTAYFRMLEGKPALYNMTDVVDMGGDKAEEYPAETLPVETEPIATEPASQDKSKGGFPWWLLIIIVVLAVAIVALMVISKSKKHKHVR